MVHHCHHPCAVAPWCPCRLEVRQPRHPGDLEVNDLTVYENTKVHQDLTVGHQATFQDDLVVHGQANLNGDVHVNAKMSLKDLTVKGKTHL